MSNNVHIPREIHPLAILPDNHDALIWRYMDGWKFRDLIRTRRLYLCRADRLQDRFEGTYARQQLLSMEGWLASGNHADIVAQERRRRQVDRQRFFINSWCMSACDMYHMWKTYTHCADAVAIQSRVSSLIKLCDQAIEQLPLDVSVVSYFDHASGQPIEYTDGFSTVIYKDCHFQLDQEIRIVHRSTLQGPLPEGIFLPVNLSELLERAVLTPGASSSDAENIRSLLNESDQRAIPVESSRYDRELME